MISSSVPHLARRNYWSSWSLMPNDSSKLSLKMIASYSQHAASPKSDNELNKFHLAVKNIAGANFCRTPRLDKTYSYDVASLIDGLPNLSDRALRSFMFNAIGNLMLRGHMPLIRKATIVKAFTILNARPDLPMDERKEKYFEALSHHLSTANDNQEFYDRFQIAHILKGLAIQPNTEKIDLVLKMVSPHIDNAFHQKPLNGMDIANALQFLIYNRTTEAAEKVLFSLVPHIEAALNTAPLSALELHMALSAFKHQVTTPGTDAVLTALVPHIKHASTAHPLAGKAIGDVLKALNRQDRTEATDAVFSALLPHLKQSSMQSEHIAAALVAFAGQHKKYSEATEAVLEAIAEQITKSSVISLEDINKILEILENHKQTPASTILLRALVPHMAFQSGRTEEDIRADLVSVLGN
jgi:hypothetical protein